MNTEFISERATDFGYVLKLERHSMGGCDPIEYESAYNPQDHYIGNPETAFQLCKERGIAPEKRSESHSVCSIGFCENEQKWYGWSHRAIYGFGVGAIVKKGDCAYVPVDMEDAKADAIRFWSEDSNTSVTAVLTKDEDGRACFDVSWKNVDDPKLIPNEKMRGKISGVRHYPPEQFGRGEWKAETLEDAKQMAGDFAEGVS